MLVPYHVKTGGEGMTSHHRLNPTGKWKYVNGPDQEDVIYVEHKGSLFKSWIHENNIEFHEEETEEVFDCKGGDKDRRLEYTKGIYEVYDKDLTGNGNELRCQECVFNCNCYEMCKDCKDNHYWKWGRKIRRGKND